MAIIQAYQARSIQAEPHHVHHAHPAMVIGAKQARPVQGEYLQAFVQAKERLRRGKSVMAQVKTKKVKTKKHK